MIAVSEIVSSMKKSPRGDLLTGSGSSNRRRWFFAQCVINLQKSLVQNVVDAEGLHKFRKINWMKSWKEKKNLTAIE